MYRVIDYLCPQPSSKRLLFGADVENDGWSKCWEQVTVEYWALNGTLILPRSVLQEHWRIRGRKNLRSGHWGGGMWDTVLEEWHGRDTHESRAAMIACIGPAWDWALNIQSWIGEGLMRLWMSSWTTSSWGLLGDVKSLSSNVASVGSTHVPMDSFKPRYPEMQPQLNVVSHKAKALTAITKDMKAGWGLARVEGFDW